MTWISLVCLLALSSSALARSVSYGSYGAPQVSSMNLVRDFNDQQQQSVLPRVSSVQQQQPQQQQTQQQQSFLPRASYGQQQQQQQPQQQQSFSSRTSFGQQQQQQPQQQLLSIQSTVGEQQDDQTEIQPIQSGYGQQYSSQQTIRRPTVQFDQTYNKVQLPVQRSYVSPAQLLEDQKQQLQQLIQESTVVTEADNLCRGQAPETIIPLDDGRRFVVCIDDTKGQEQKCPRGLLFHQESRRCERKLGPLENPCSSQPCLNNGQCVQTDFSSFKCQCAPGFDGEHCELDATVCQTQQPCGQSPDTKCQSFRAGAALQHVCILQGGRAYGLTASQAQASPCTGVDGTFPLAFSDKGFIMCSGELMYVESCPGGTIWDDLNKACVWPDMQGVTLEDQTSEISSYGGVSSYKSAPRTINTQYGAKIPQQFDSPMKSIQSYGQTQMRSFNQPKLIPQQDDVQSYGQTQMRSFSQPKFLPQQDNVQSYGQSQMRSFTQPKMLSQQDDVQSYGQSQMRSFSQPKMISQQDDVQSYGQSQSSLQQDQIQQQPQQIQQFQQQQPQHIQQIQQQQQPQIRQQSSYGGYQQTLPKQLPRQQDTLRVSQQSGY